MRPGRVCRCWWTTSRSVRPKRWALPGSRLPAGYGDTPETSKERPPGYHHESHFSQRNSIKESSVTQTPSLPADIADQIPAELWAVLDGYGFDATRFEAIRQAVASGALGPDSNVVSGAVEPLRDEDVTALPSP